MEKTNLDKFDVLTFLYQTLCKVNEHVNLNLKLCKRHHLFSKCICIMANQRANFSFKHNAEKEGFTLSLLSK